MLKILFMQIKLPMSSYYRMFGIFQGERRIDYLYNFFFFGKWAILRCFSGIQFLVQIHIFQVIAYQYKYHNVDSAIAAIRALLLHKH